MSDDTEYYTLAIEDLFRVPADRVEDEQHAKEYLLERLGTDPYLVYEAKVIEGPES